MFRSLTRRMMVLWMLSIVARAGLDLPGGPGLVLHLIELVDGIADGPGLSVGRALQSGQTVLLWGVRQSSGRGSSWSRGRDKGTGAVDVAARGAAARALAVAQGEGNE